MTWGSRLRLLLGMLLVLVAAAVATYLLNQNRGHVQSDSAQIAARTYSVGTPYEGLVVDQRVQVGDDPLRVPVDERDVVQGYFQPQN